jgi:hypothetical protein
MLGNVLTQHIHRFIATWGCDIKTKRAIACKLAVPLTARSFQIENRGVAPCIVAAPMASLNGVGLLKQTHAFSLS